MRQSLNFFSCELLDGFTGVPVSIFKSKEVDRYGKITVLILIRNYLY